MGMAAGQARLLSITTRMSDNELRAQLINNDKMRLATKSAQVSEAYTTALNEAQMMFTNYDADNKTSYKELTYNALTAYNPYNNQYAISNASGQVLVSETDATNFKKANGDLNKFLASYGLEYSTDYFSSLISTNVQTAKEAITDSDGNILVAAGGSYLAYKTGETDAKNNAIYDYISFADYSEVGGATLTEVLQNMYNGVDKTHPGYDATKSSLDYLTYTGDLSNYEKAYSSMLELVNDKMSTELQKVVGKDHSRNELTFAQAYETFAGSTIPSTQQWESWLYVLSNIIGVDSGIVYTNKEGDTITGPTGLYVYASDEGKKYLKQLKDFVDNNNKDYFESSYYNEAPGAKQGTLTYKQSETDTILTYKEADASDSDDGMQFKKTDPNTYTLILKNADGSYTTLTGEELRETPGKITYTYYQNDEGTIATTATDGYTKCQVQIDPSIFAEDNYDENGKLNDAKLLKKIVDLEQNTDDNRKNVGAQVVKEIQNGITNIWDYAASDGTNGAFSKFTDAKLGGGKFQTFMEAAKKFYKDMFGDEIISNPTSSDDILFKMNNIEELKKAINAKAKNTEEDDNATAEAKAKAKAAAESFKKIYDVYILDCVMNTYGEPKFTWIDQNDKNANGEHKAQWYTNLFNRMKTGGYKTLQNGLASSTEWIKFAFESGLVTLEQVDGSNTWNSTTYSNCSDITEQTNSTAVTIAEAEYNAQMNKIQNKDKMYDLELKNIDTEHNSLQTEYESIKGAIDKNIERTFKIYS